MKCTFSIAVTTALLGLAFAADTGNAECVKGSKDKCAAETKLSSKARPPHYALLQVRDRLSFTALRSGEDHEEVPKQHHHEAHPHQNPHQLPAESLINVKVFQEPTANLTAFDLDYLQDASNPLDVGMAQPSSGSTVATGVTATGTHEASSSSSGSASTEEAGSSSTASCCKNKTVECISCQAGLTVEAYCATHTEESGCGEIFDCTAGLEHWETGWSNIKMIYCCNKMNVGCTGANKAAAASATAANGSIASGDSWEQNYLTDGNISSSPAARDGVAHGAAGVGSNYTPPGTCVTRLDPRASSVGYTSALPGTPCVFGVDDRDENSHCIMDDGRYGSFGWCWTNVDRSSWGSCSESCPLFGPDKVLGDLVKSLENKVDAALATTTVTTTVTTTNMTNTTTMAENTTKDDDSDEKDDKDDNSTKDDKDSNSTDKDDSTVTTTTEASKAPASGKGPGGNGHDAAKGPASHRDADSAKDDKDNAPGDGY